MLVENVHDLHEGAVWGILRAFHADALASYRRVFGHFAKCGVKLSKRRPPPETQYRPFRLAFEARTDFNGKQSPQTLLNIAFAIRLIIFVIRTIIE